MTPQSEDPQHYCIELTLTKSFLQWTRSHRLLDGPAALNENFWKNTAELSKVSFGGKYGTQFKTMEQIQSFNLAFDDLLSRKGIDAKHKHPLLYLMVFLGQDVEQQSIVNNRINHIHDYAIFILDMIADSLSHIAKMRKNEIYQEVYDEYTQEIFFAKKELVETMPYEELIEYFPTGKQADDIIKYLRIAIYEDELYIPKDIVMSIRSREDRKLKSFTGKQENSFRMPHNLEYEVFTYMVKKMLDLHKKHNTEFYKLMISDSIMSDFKPIVQKYKKLSISNTTSLRMVGTLVTDYLIHEKLYTSKRSIASFLFEYFALFKAITLKRPVSMPEDYSDLIKFYIKNGVNGELIRLTMKDAQ